MSPTTIECVYCHTTCDLVTFQWLVPHYVFDRLPVQVDGYHCGVCKEDFMTSLTAMEERVRSEGDKRLWTILKDAVVKLESHGVCIRTVERIFGLSVYDLQPELEGACFFPLTPLNGKALVNIVAAVRMLLANPDPKQALVDYHKTVNDATEHPEGYRDVVVDMA